MGRVGEESDLNSRLVTQICSIPKQTLSCSHKRGGNPARMPFVDWYLVLQVEENAGVDVIRKQYRKLGRFFFSYRNPLAALLFFFSAMVKPEDIVLLTALQLHPDKNKHPKAEIAFKIVSEAYECLCDNARRAEFNLERQNSKCIECIRIQHLETQATKIQRLLPIDRTQKPIAGLKELRARLSEEIRVIDNCLKAIAIASTKECPVFNPTDYLFQDYPHQRIWLRRKFEGFPQHMRADKEQDYKQCKRDSPIFEFR